MIEHEILGCFLKDNTLIEETIIQTNQFEMQAHQLLFQSMKKLSMEGKAIDKVTLLQENYDYIQQMGGVDFITSLETNGNPVNFDSYEKQFIEQYKEKESKRRVKLWLSDESKNEQELIEELEKVSELGISEEETKDDVLDSMYNDPYEEREKAGITSGLSDLDAITGMFQNKSSYILAARPSLGKTATMLTFKLAAMKKGIVPITFSLEMPKVELLRRMIATIGNINLFIARNPYELTDSKKKEWQRAINELKQYKFEIFDNSSMTINEMRSHIRKIKKKHPGKQIMVLIDYLTLIRSDKNYQSDHQKFTDISSQLKPIAKDYDCPIITLAQLSRAVEQRQDKRPMLSDLRESGSIEQDADGVMFLYRESYYNNEVDNDNLEINLAKHRNGPTGTATVYYNKSTGQMGDLSAY